MAVERIFMGWSRPALHLAVDNMYARFHDGDTWDMSSVLVVLPSRRAARRLRELLVLKVDELKSLGCGNARLLPPLICTIGELAELLNPPCLATASEIDGLMAMAFSLSSLSPQEAGQIVPGPKASGRTMDWLRAADSLLKLRQELAAAGVTFQMVEEAAASLPNSVAIQQRWHLLRSLHERCKGVLMAAGVQDRDSVREAGLTEVTSATVGSSFSTVVMVGILESPKFATRLIGLCRCPVVALIHAGSELAEGFTDTGCLNAQFWQSRMVDINDNCISMVHSPTDQAREVASIISGLVKPIQSNDSSDPKFAHESPCLTGDYISVACADEALLGPVERAVELSGMSARPPRLDTAARTPPFVLLALLADFLQSYSPDAFARLVRHPDIERWLIREWRLHIRYNAPASSQDIKGSQPPSISSLPGLLDMYMQQSVPGRILHGEPGMVPQLSHAAELVLSLEQGASEKQALCDWAGTVRKVISTIYGGRKFSNTNPDDQPSAQAISLLGDHLRAWRITQLPTHVQSALTFTEALELLVWRAGEAEITPPEEIGSVQLSGWLEVSLDDSPVLIVTGVNEGNLPRSVNTDPFVPDSLRETLGMNCNKSRYARDLFVLSSAAHCRPVLHVIAGRVTADNSPLAPSRLLTACDSQRLVIRTLRFYTEHETSDVRPLLPFSETGTLAEIAMPDDHPVLQRLNVTAFRDYLACPYRFYLRHVLRLRTIDEDPRELAPNQFGDLAHYALHTYANRVIERDHGISSQSANEIAEELTAALDDALHKRFGSVPRAAAVLQGTRLRARLAAFAQKQHELFREGWRVIAAEQELTAELLVDDVPFTIYGRVDRLDANEASGQCRVLDYKTAAKVKKPDQIHRKGRKDDKRWVDLQLPLYVHLAHAFNRGFNSVLPGYLLLPATVDDIGLYMADSWTTDDLATADETAFFIIRQLRAQCFWPPSDPAGLYADGFERLALDSYPDRKGVIGRQTGLESLASNQSGTSPKATGR